MEQTNPNSNPASTLGTSAQQATENMTKALEQMLNAFMQPQAQQATANQAKPLPPSPPHQRTQPSAQNQKQYQPRPMASMFPLNYKTPSEQANDDIQINIKHEHAELAVVVLVVIFSFFLGKFMSKTEIKSKLVGRLKK